MLNCNTEKLERLFIKTVLHMTANVYKYVKQLSSVLFATWTAGWIF